MIGFPDVQLSFIVNGLGGQLDLASNNPERNESNTCSQSQEFTRASVTDYMGDIFTTEDYLLDSLSQIGATATNIAVTPNKPNMHHYGGGLFYNTYECLDYAEEPVPEECVQEREGRLTSVSTSTVSTVPSAERLPKHCDIFFKDPSVTLKFPHSVTVVGYGEVRLQANHIWPIRFIRKQSNLVSIGV